MEHQDAAKKLAELGHTTRLAIYRMLVKAGAEGLAVSDIQQQLEIPGSTLSHHIGRLVGAGLMVQERLHLAAHASRIHDRVPSSARGGVVGLRPSARGSAPNPAGTHEKRSPTEVPAVFVSPRKRAYRLPPHLDPQA